MKLALSETPKTGLFFFFATRPIIMFVTLKRIWVIGNVIKRICMLIWFNTVVEYGSMTKMKSFLFWHV